MSDSQGVPKPDRRGVHERDFVLLNEDLRDIFSKLLEEDNRPAIDKVHIPSRTMLQSWGNGRGR